MEEATKGTPLEETVKGIPYGNSRFDEVRTRGLYYVDKTMYLPMLEDTGDFLFLIRPRRFGKSLLVSMMRAYYDIAQAGRFDTLFQGLWIHTHPTPLKNSFQIIYFDFSLVGNGKDEDELSDNFNRYCCRVLDAFAQRYEAYYGQCFVEKVMSESHANTKLIYIKEQAEMHGYRLYLIIDEYDNFTNVILSERGADVFRRLTHASGFYREYFKIFKAMFSRVFLIGVSPVTLDDLSSGYNIDWGISQDPRFNYMLGFGDSEVRTMFQYYKDNGKLPANTDIDRMIEEMRPWYNNYCFCEECLDKERVFNCDMVLYYLRCQVLDGHAPRDMVDKNIRTDYSKLKMLADIDRGTKRGQRMSVIEEIAATGEVKMVLKTSFPAEKVASDDNFRSLLYYYGLLTMGATYGQRMRMVIPNNCVREQYWSFMRDYYERSMDMDISALRDEMDYMAMDGNWHPFIERVARAYRDCSSVRDSILGEHNLQGFFKAYMAMNTYYLVWPEHELNYGYSDFLLVGDRRRYPMVEHSYILELKYVKTNATHAELEAKCQEAGTQLTKYAHDTNLIRQCEGMQLHFLRIVFRGAEIAVCEELHM